MLGPALFTIYTASLGRLLDAFGVQYHFYADDSSLYVTFEPDGMHSTVTHLEQCLVAVQNHMIQKKLKMNSTKTDVLLIATKTLMKEIPGVATLTIGEDAIPISEAVRYIGVMLDKHLSMVDHINTVCKTALMHLHNIGRIRKMLSKETCEQLVHHALITTKLDYSNAILYGLPDVHLKKLQRLQNIAARIVTLTPRRAHITPVLIELHWLPVRERIMFKVCLMVYKCLHGVAPTYLDELLVRRPPVNGLRSASVTTLVVPRHRSDFECRAFGVCGPKLWNSLTAATKNTDSLDDFKKKLKTELFRKAYF